MFDRRLHIAVQSDDFDPQAVQERLTAGRTDVGAVCAFTGLCRSENDTLTALELEHYPGMAEAKLEETARAALARWPLDAMAVIHRHGMIRPGERIVFVAATSRHRDAAFEACRFVMDFLKTDAPFWKKEHRADGADGRWVDARDGDDEARSRWLGS